MRFLLIEDNEALAKAVLDRLGMDGHVVDHAGDLETAMEFTATTDYDLILLDIMLPDGDGRSFLTHHRAGKSLTPVIVTVTSSVAVPSAETTVKLSVSTSPAFIESRFAVRV